MRLRLLPHPVQPSSSQTSNLLSNLFTAAELMQPLCDNLPYSNASVVDRQITSYFLPSSNLGFLPIYITRGFLPVFESCRYIRIVACAHYVTPFHMSIYLNKNLVAMLCKFPLSKSARQKQFIEFVSLMSNNTIDNDKSM